ncbi:MAG: PAS domain S-box protein [Chloroflexi bacterium]|nr:PAS domain S-box protein [Chloroflexota bacterium]
MRRTTGREDFEAELRAARQEIARLQAEAAEARGSYRDLFENAGDSIFLIDAGTYRILDVNEHAARRLGYARAALIGMSMDAVEVTDDNADTPEIAWESSFSGTQVYECRHRHKDGHLIPVEVASRVIQIAGRDVLRNFARNIALRKQMEMEREQLIADLDSFAHTVAHDLKSPMAMVVSFATFVEEAWSSLSAEEIQHNLHLLTGESRKALSIVDELLLFASVRRLDQVERGPLDMPPLIDEVLQRFGILIEYKHAEISVPKSWPVAIGYAPWVTEIWANYISNGIKYGGSPPRVELGGVLESDGMVRFWARDNGPGIAPDELPKLFQPFNRLGRVQTQGYGLGLSIVKRIAEKLGGSVRAESALGQGSLFSFTLPGAG